MLFAFASGQDGLIRFPAGAGCLRLSDLWTELEWLKESKIAGKGGALGVSEVFTKQGASV
jgi:hypothetical protein